MKPRPTIIGGTTRRVETGVGAVHVTCNNDESGMFEVFLHVGKSGSIIGGLTEALGRILSAALRHGVPPEELAAQLVGIRSGRHTMHGGKMIWSLPHAVGMCMLLHMGKTVQDVEGIETDPHDDDTQEVFRQ